MDGPAIIRGYNGGSEQYFFGSVSDLNDNMPAGPQDYQIESDFQQNVYVIGASLTNYLTYYEYAPQNNRLNRVPNGSSIFFTSVAGEYRRIVLSPNNKYIIFRTSPHGMSDRNGMI
ncbi:MAG: hypothetical protein GY795_39590 [Desulfobacterales bacterium]|nr:hypothetical protein [Desulfobacterales bacterium]